ncbi:DUF2306 domain-containing protein [Pendulispora rubella]|uniref:DUF2306 domain-containing protein n=1 Tax=Pendulispora rubella TaxID=2741070 RepID=A0ABZ2L2Z2_9BACT
MSRIRATTPRVLVLSVMALGAAFITASSLAYFNLDELPPFVIEKLPLRFEALWLASLRVHVVAALLSFPLCILLMTRAIQRRAVWHRWMGRIAGSVVLFALVPSGVVLSFEAKGGPLVSAGFLLSAALVAWFMVKGVLAARRKELGAHRRAMLHVFAQMSVAVTSRALLFGLDAAGMSPDVAYVIALWCPVFASAAIAEWVAGSFKRMVQAHGFKMASFLRARVVARPAAHVGHVRR